ncbi:MAG TPA: DNA polymerase III subunit alpha [Rectinemataceae bacterium]|nr:DNA polymerase III subunit alpha [Rectinemataceae bacterium]
MAQFVHLHNHSDYSLLDGAASVESMVAKAVQLGMPALALTDHGNMFGAVKFYRACVQAGINPILGSEFYVAGGSRKERTGTETGNKYWHLVLLARDQEGYRNLLKLSSASYTEGYYYKPRIDDEILAAHSKGLIASTACLAGEIPSLLLAGRAAEAERKARWYAELFGPGHYYLELQDHGIPEQKTVNKAMVELAKKTGLPLIATNDMHYLERGDAEAHDILLCIGTNRKRSELERMRFHGPEFYMKSPEEMAAIFPELPEALENTLRISEMVDLKLEFPGPLLPEYEVPPEFSSPDEYLRHLTREGLKRRYASLTEEIVRRAEYELDVIIKMKFTGYFLIVWDFIDWAKNRGIPVGPGRGSGAGSIVAYALRITDIDPLRYELLFERFLNPERISMPDFDVDFCFERRGEVINYVTQKYGADRTGQIITFGTLKAKAVIKDVARVLDIPFDESNNIAKLVPEDPKMTLKKAFEQEPKLRELASQERYHDLFEVAAKLENKNRHTSFHAAGIVIGKTALTDYVPLFKDPKTGIVSTQFTMDLLEDCGLVKMDFLGLKTLTLIKNTIDLIRARGVDIEEDRIPDDDARTFELLGEGKSTSVFQFESSGMQAILKQAKPTSIEDIIALNALYRPGPMDNIPQFIDAKWGRKPISYPHPSLEKYLKETYGVIVYQEQVMQVAQEVAGYSLGRADLLRRAMGKKKKEVLEKEEAPFIEGAVARGYAKEKAKEIFDILVPFAGYGFNKSHAAAYSVVAYRTAYLKANYPAEFMAANLTNEIADTDKLTAYIGEARSMGLEVLPPDVNASEAYFSVVDGRIVYGLLGIKGVGEALAKAVANERRKRGPFASFIDFVERLGTQAMNRKSLECLAMAGCFDALGREAGTTRRAVVLEVERALEYAAGKEAAGRYGQASLFDGSGEEEYPPFLPQSAEEYPRAEILRIEKELLGFHFSGHPLDEWRKIWERSCDLDLANADRASPDRLYTLVAMLKEWREIVTKTGRKMAFGAVEDFSGSVEIVVFADVLERFRERFVLDGVLCLKGKVDQTRGKSAFKVEDFADPASLKERSWKEVHLRLRDGISDEEDLYGLRDAILDEPGSCNVYFHVPSEGDEAVVKAHVQITCSASESCLERLREVPVVEAVWRD